MGASWWVVPFRRSRPRDLPVVTGRSFETMWEAEFARSGALLDLYTVDGCDTATTGEARIVVTDPVSGSARVADSWRSGPGLGRHHRGPFPLPEAARIHLAVQYRRVSGTGNVYVVVADGVQCHG
jgi:hypothetical protein